MASTTVLRQKYRSLCRLVQRLPEPERIAVASSSSSSSSLPPCPDAGLRQLRASFRAPFVVNESIDDRLLLADKQIAFLKMITPKQQQRENATATTARWVYRNGKRLEGGTTTVRRDAKGNVVSNWDGKNLDPDNIKQHKYQLNRMGFRNNAHAKGIF